MQTVKGAQRRVIQVRIGNSRYYEEVLFILKKEVSHLRTKDGEMIAEANRILRESTGWEEAKKPRTAKLLWLFSGFFFGAALAFFIFFLRFAT